MNCTSHRIRGSRKGKSTTVHEETGNYSIHTAEYTDSDEVSSVVKITEWWSGRVVVWMIVDCVRAKRMGWVPGAWLVLVDSACQLSGSAGGCLAFRTSNTVPADGWDGSGNWSSGSTLPCPSFVKRRRAGKFYLVLPLMAIQNQT